MDKCHYYLSNGLWKIAHAYFDYRKREQNDYFWAMAVLPNYNSFGSHIISTPWQQSWATMDILQSGHESLTEEEIKNEAFGMSEINILRREVNFQYILRNYSSQPFVQQLFTTYSRIQTHLLVNYSEVETKAFIAKLMLLLKMLLNECPSSAHSLLQQMFKHGFFFVNCLKAIMNDVKEDSDLCSLLLQGLCQSETIQIHLPYVLNLSQSPFRYQLCLMLIASDNIPFLQSIIEEDKKFFHNDTENIIDQFLERGFEPLKNFTYMLTMERHFLFQILDLIKLHMDVFSSSNYRGVPSFMWPLVLIYCWNDDSVPAEVIPVLIDKCKESSKDRIILQIAFILEWYLNFSVWYESQGSGDSLRIDRKSDLLEKAKEHSALYLINNSTDLSETDWRQILELLKNGKSRVDIMNSWDIILFDGYRIIIHVFQIIISSTELYNFAKAQKTRLSNIAFLNEVFSSLYVDEVTGRLKLVKQLIKTLYPLNFRLEILENIFSLVFLQYEDVKKLKFYSKISEIIAKLVQLKFKYMEKTGICTVGRSFSFVHHQHLNKSEEEELKKSKRKGFICKKYIIRDLLYLVKECLGKFEEDFRSQTEGKSCNVPCSIDLDQMENRLDRLYESVNEATWRLQLISDPDFTSQGGIMHYPCGQDPFHHFDGDWIFLPHESERGVAIKSRKKSAEKTNDSGSQSHSSTGNGNSSGETQTVKHKIPSPAIMNQMLSSDSSLVIHCLAQGDVLNANHIIQTLSAEENKQTLEGELQFTESINDLKKKLQNISLESPAKKYGTDGNVSKSFNLQSIKMVANQGVTSTALANHIERFLSVSTLPSIQGASKVSVGSMLQCIENTQAIVTIDLALTSEMTFQDFKGLLNIASKHCPELSTRIQSPISAQTLFSKPLGYIVFSQNIIALLEEINKSQLSESDTEISLHQFLRSHGFPFSLKSLKDSINFWKQMKQAIWEFEKCDSEYITSVSNKEVTVGKCQKNMKEMQKIFESVKKLVEGCSEFMDLGKIDSSPNEISKSVNYLDLLSRYLTDLAAFILENIPSKSDAFESVSFRSLLEQSAVDIVDRLIFQYCVEPTVLEKKAQQLGFNLSASLVAGCCPRLPQNVSVVGERTKCPPIERIVLNELVSDYISTEQANPAEVVENIFSELLIAFQNYSRNKIVDGETPDGASNIFTELDIVELRSDFRIQRILEKTLQFNFVTLEYLRDDELLVFFTNLLNLMLCHCYLITKLDSTDGVYSNFAINRDVGYMFLGYNLGELGFVSIYDVKSRILGNDICSVFTLIPHDAWKRLNFSTDPRIVFAVNDFRSTAPCLQFYKIDSFDSKLEEAISRYLEHSVRVKNGQLIITDLLEWYLDRVLFCRETFEDHSLHIKHVLPRKMKLLKFLIKHSPAEIQSQLNELSASDLDVKVQSASKELSLILDYGIEFYYEGITIEVTREKWRDRRLSDSILRHLSQSSRVLADIVQKVHEAKEPAQTEVGRDVLTEEKLKYLDSLLGAPWCYHLAPLFDNNPIITALGKYPSEGHLNSFLQECVSKRDWIKCLDILFELPDYYMSSSLNLQRLRDVVLREVTLFASQNHEEHPWYYSQHISDINIRLETVKYCTQHWSGSVCIGQLSSILCDYPNLRTDLLEEIRCLIRKIRVYHTISETVSDYAGKSWFEVYSSVSTSPHVVLQNLVKANQMELCLQWINLPGILNSIHQYIDSDFILLVLNLLSNDFELIDQLLNSLPQWTLLSVCDKVIHKLKSIPLISHLVRLLLRINPALKYEVISFSVNILKDLSADEQSELIHLISHPILIIEQLLMNMRLDALEIVLKKVRESTENHIIDQTEVNKLIASYASKAVKFDFVKTVKSPEIMQSFLLEARSQTQQGFVVPTEVCDKSQWIPDNQVSVCMCCQLVSFSMFNRRHHCRRCGRVICSACSPHQLKIPNYRGVAVRVCHTCYYHETKIELDYKCTTTSDMLSATNVIQEVRTWKLSPDSSRNATVREEFSFEYVPNVSLCLAIFNLLPDPTYSSVLLDESEKMLKMLQLNGKSENLEIDCGVLVKIIRSLIIGAKVKYGQASLATGVLTCDRLLSQVDLLHLLIKNHYWRLIPSEPLNGHALRCLRDKLVEEELWDLAIEVSTKCGLDRNGVWAAWGKVCLTAGSWEEARLKFSYCLDSATKPSRNPSLVDEICRILESANSFVGFKQAAKLSDKNVPTQEVTQILSNLKWLAQGKQLSFSTISSKNSIQYNEQIYYLSTYGSHQGLLAFYLRHEEWKAALTYFLEQQLDSDIFIEAILMPSFKSDQQNRLKAEMLSLDVSLELFKKYLCHACLFLQKLDYLHILYEVQLLMQDYIRAAATCTRLYQRFSSNYTELVSRSSYLHTALRHLEEEMSSMTKKAKRLDCIMKLDARELNKHMNTIWRQLEVAKFLGGCEAQGKFIQHFFPEYVSKGDEIATLFDGSPERIILASLIILCGTNIAEGFGIAYRIMQDYQLDPMEVYLITGKKLVETQRIVDLEALIDCIKTCGMENVTTSVDHILSTCVPLLVRSGEVDEHVDKLINQITNVDLKISALVDARQLKSAYLLAVRHNRLNEVRRIREVADQMGLTSIKKICTKKLEQSTEGSTSSSAPSVDKS